MVELTTAVDGFVNSEFHLVPYTVTLVPSQPAWVVARSPKSGADLHRSGGPGGRP